MQTLQTPQLFNKMILSGLAGTFAVSVQTASLNWINNLFQNQVKNNLNFYQCAIRKIQKEGIMSLFKGSFSTFTYTSLARFGDLANNFLVLQFFKNDQDLNETPFFIQSWFSWALASAWRICLTPIQIYTNSSTFRYNAVPNRNRQFMRTYLKQIKPQILSLYSWFLVQNYLIEYTQNISYSESPLKAFLRYGSIGFLSMSSYELYKKTKQTFLKSSINNKFWVKRAIFRGLNGTVFCSVSQLIKQKLQE